MLCTVILVENPAQIPSQRGASDTLGDVTGVSALLIPDLPISRQADEALAAAERVIAGRPGTIAVAITDLASGDTAANAAASTPMYSASLIKLVSALDVAVRSEAPVAGRDAEWIARALGPSDDEAMNALWSVFDGVGAIARVSGTLGLTQTRPADRPSQWGESWTSASDMVAVLEYLYTGVSAADRDLVLGAMAAPPPIATDRFDQAYGLFTVPGRTVVKQGWMCCQRGLITLHSMGSVGGRYLVAVLSAQPLAVGRVGARATLDDVTTAITDALSGTTDIPDVSASAPIVAP